MGVDARGFPGGTPEARSRLCICRASFLMTFATGGVPHSGPQHWRMFHVHLRRMCILLLLDGMLNLCFLIFFLDDLSIDISGVLKSPTIIVVLLIYPLLAVSICLIYCGAPTFYLGYIYIYSCCIFLK